MAKKEEKPFQLNVRHWQSDLFSERITVKQWREILLAHKDMIVFHGTCRRLVAKNLGAGVVEITKGA